MESESIPMIIRPHDADDIAREACRAAGIDELSIKRLEILRDLMRDGKRDETTFEWKRMNFIKTLWQAGVYWLDGGPLSRRMRDRAA